MLILKSTLDEICQGLECDLDLQDQLLWQQNMHTLILYGLLKKTYKAEEKKSGIPVLSSLDVLVQVLPQFSRHLYIELVKKCSWEHLMIDVSDRRIDKVLFGHVRRPEWLDTNQAASGWILIIFLAFLV